MIDPTQESLMQFLRMLANIGRSAWRHITAWVILSWVTGCTGNTASLTQTAADRPAPQTQDVEKLSELEEIGKRPDLKPGAAEPSPIRFEWLPDCGVDFTY